MAFENSPRAGRRPPNGNFTPSQVTPASWRVRTYLFWLVIACLLPGIIGAAVLSIYEYQQGRMRTEKDTLQTVRALSQAVDNQILKVEALAHGLATAGSLAQGDFAGFHRQARQTLKQANLVASVTLIDRSGWQVLNTLKEFGEPLPFNNNPNLVRRVFETGKPVVSDLYIGAILQRPIMTVAVPVITDDTVAYVLIAPILPEKFNAILGAQGLPANWVASIFDGTGTIVARTTAAQEFLGKKAAPDFRQRFLTAAEGSMESRSADGIPIFTVFVRSPVTTWGVSIEIPRHILETPLVHSLLVLALGVAALFAVGLGVAQFLGGRLSRSIRALVAPALALGEGKIAPLPPMEVMEAAELARAIGKAAELIQQRTTALSIIENRLQALTQHAPVAIAVFDRDMRYVACSTRWLEEFGLAEEGVVGQCHYDLFPDIPEKWKDAHRRGLAGEVVRAKADSVERTDGSLRWFNWEVWPWRDQNGVVAGIVIADEEITERKEAEDALKQAQDMLAEGQKIAHLGSFEYVAATKMTVWSAEEYRIYGLDPARSSPSYEEMLAKFIHPEDAAELDRRFVKAMESCSIYEFEHRILRPDGSVRWVYDRAQPYFDESGNFLRYVGTTLDITDRKQAEDELRQLKDNLETLVQERTVELMAANRELEAFTFATSHDLRGPLGRIASFTTLLERTCRDRLEGDSLLFLDIIRQNASRLTLLVDDLLSHARVAQQALERQSIDIAEVVKSIVQEKKEENVDLKAEIRVNLPPVKVLADPHALSQALGNLVENAIKYSSPVPSPLIDIGGELVGERYRLWVRDNGIGFKMEYHDKIFQMFQRLHTYTEFAGSGVGLALVRRAMERMGGKVWAESAPGQGATFYLELQAAS